MRALGLTDTIFFNLGHRYITSVVVLDAPADADRVLAELQAVVKAYPPLAERYLHLWPWFVAYKDRRFDLANHVCTVVDPSVRDLETLVPIIEKARRTVTPPAHAPWRAFILNPAQGGKGQDSASANKALSVVIFQFKHGLADAARGFQVLSRMGRAEPPPASLRASQLRTLSRAEFMALRESGSIDDAGLSIMQIPRDELRRDQDSNTRLVTAAASILADPALYSHATPLNGRIAKTRLVRRRAGRRALGNHLETVAEPVGIDGANEQPPQRWRVPGLERAQSLPLARYFVAISPPPLARLLMRQWYSRFDAMVTMLPAPPNLTLGGSPIAGIFGVPPLSGPIPLALLATSCGAVHNMVVIPGRTFSGERTHLHKRLLALLRGRKTAEEAPRKQADREPEAIRRSVSA